MGRLYYKGIIASAVVLMLVSTIAVGAALWLLRDDAITEAVRETENIATILAQQVDHSSRAIELVLDETIAEIHRRALADPTVYDRDITSKAVNDFLKDRLARLPQADVVTVTDRNGRVLNITRAWPAPVLDLSDRDYFRHLSSTPGAGLFVSQPVQNRVTGTWVVYFAKRVEAADGSFMGVVQIGFRPEYFLSVLDVITSIPDRSLLLLRSDGTVLVRYPDPINRTGFKMPAGSEWYGLMPGGGHYRTVGVFDDEARWVVARPATHYPLVVNVAISEAQALAGWRARAVAVATCTLLVELLFAVLAWSLFRQIARLHESEAALCEKSSEIGLANARFAAALTSMSHGIAMFDRDGGLVIHNRTYEQIWGLRPGEMFPGKACVDIVAGCIEQGLFAGGTSRFDPEHPHFIMGERHSETLDLCDGRSIRVTRDPMSDGGWVTIHEDITERRRAEARIAHLAHYDALTDLANRTLFMNQLRAFIDGEGGGDCAVLLVDLDHFKEVNDNFGHGIGDALLHTVAERLAATVRAGDLVARLGGDEFAIVCALDPARGDASHSLSRVEHMAARMLESIGRPYAIEGHEISIGLSIGITFVRADGSDTERVMRQADLALYRAKSDGRNRFRLFEATMEEEYRARQSLTADLRDAVVRDELELHYQPIFDTITLEIRTMEALVRWNHPTRGRVPPSLFVPIAEESGVIQALGEWVLMRAAIEAAGWSDQIKIAVNVSTLQIGQPDFPDVVARVLHESGLAPERLLLEITESVLLSDANRAVATLHMLHRMGVSIVLDDFGTGYSSLSYLKQFPFDEIKIDKSFVDDIAGHRGCAAIVSATITLAREFDMLTTAEGVETPEQYELLRATGVTQIQGYLFGRPAPATAWDLTRPGVRAEPPSEEIRATIRRHA